MAIAFEFPDSAVFPENEAPVYEGDDGPDFAEASRFSQDLAALKLRALDFLGERENAILNEQINRIAHTEVLYRRSPRSTMEPGIVFFHRDTARLESFFAEDIRKALCLPPPADVKTVDGAIVRKDRAAKEMVARFLGATRLPRSVTVHVSRPGDRHHYQQFRDCKTTTRLLNLHMDPKPGVTKAIVYLSEVTEEDGPFQFIAGSQDWEIDPIQRLFAWGNSVGNYLHTSEHRRVASAFPSRYRRNAIVGRLIPDGSDLSEILLRSLKTFTSDVANVMVFDPSYNLHRGGQCRTGMRVNLQVIL